MDLHTALMLSAATVSAGGALIACIQAERATRAAARAGADSAAAATHRLVARGNCEAARAHSVSAHAAAERASDMAQHASLSKGLALETAERVRANLPTPLPPQGPGA